MVRCTKSGLLSLFFTHVLAAASDYHGMPYGSYGFSLAGIYRSFAFFHIPGDTFKFFRGRSGAQDDRYVYEKQRYDGWFNNMAHPEWGSIGEMAWDIN